MLPHKFRRNPDKYLGESRYRIVRKTVRPVFKLLNYRNWLGAFFEEEGFAFAGPGKGAVSRFYEKHLSARRDKIFKQHNYPKISVIVPAYNAETFIKSSIQSLLEQSYENIEIIVVDDSSTDATEEIVKMLISRDARISWLATDQQKGAAYCRNLGLSTATGKFVTFHDADDLSAPSRLELQLSRLLAPDRARVCLCNYVRVDQDGERMEINGETVRKCIISMMFQRQQILQNIGYFQHIKVSSDADFYERMKRFYGPGCETVVFRTLYQALFRTDSLTMANSENLQIDGKKLTYARSGQTEELWQELRHKHKKIEPGSPAAFIPFAR